MNKMIMLVGLLVAIMSVSAFGAGFLGTPTAELEKGQWSAGFSYTFIDMDLDTIKLTEKWEYFDLGSGLGDSSGVDKFKLDMKDVKTQRYYGTIGYGVADWCEVFVQLGFADVKGKTRDDPPDGDDWEGHNFDNDFAWGLGTRITFYEQNNIRWGTSVQMNWLDTSVDYKDAGAGWTEKQQIDFETFDLLIAVGPTVDMGGWKLYGGPFYYYLSGDLDAKGTYSEPGWELERWKASGDIEAKSNFGGFVGAQFPLTGNCDMTTELSFTGDSWAFGTGIVWKF